MKSVEQRVITVISRSAMISEDVIHRESELDSLGVGSLEQIECVMAIEDEFEVELPIADLRRLRTVGDVIDAVGQALADAKAR